MIIIIINIFIFGAAKQQDYLYFRKPHSKTFVCFIVIFSSAIESKIEGEICKIFFLLWSASFPLLSVNKHTVSSFSAIFLFYLE